MISSYGGIICLERFSNEFCAKLLDKYMKEKGLQDQIKGETLRKGNAIFMYQTDVNSHHSALNCNRCSVATSWQLTVRLSTAYNKWIHTCAYSAHVLQRYHGGRTARRVLALREMVIRFKVVRIYGFGQPDCTQHGHNLVDRFKILSGLTRVKTIGTPSLRHPQLPAWHKPTAIGASKPRKGSKFPP